jgi:hypothetical protein
MADRNASADFLAELLKSSNSPCFLVEAWFDDGVIRMTDAWTAVPWAGNTYVQQGHFLGFSGLSETAELQVPSLQLMLSSVDQSWIAIALTKPYLDRRLVIYKAFLNYASMALIASPVIVFDGRMDGMVLADDPQGACTIQVTATSQWGDFDRKAGRHTNPQEQQVFFPGDRFFDYVAQLNKEVKWGAA